MSRSLTLLMAVLVSHAPLASAQSAGPAPPHRRWFVGSSLFMVANVATDDPPSFYQMNVGRWLSPRDTLSVEVLTWRYTHPLGIPYGPSFGNKKEAYPGAVRSAGAGLAYQRFWWRGLYSAVHATALRQDYQDLEERSILQGFQLFATARVGYHLEFLDHRLFAEPSVGITHWPINTNVPAAFKALDDKWPSRFVGEPGFHIGVRF